MHTKQHPSRLEHCPVISCRALLKCAAAAAVLFSCILLAAQNAPSQPRAAASDPSAGRMTPDDYVKAKGDASRIVFDASNIKRFWVDGSVLCQDGTILVFLDRKMANGFEGVPLKIQLLNVDESMDCKVEILAGSQDAAFEIMDGKSKVLSRSSAEPPYGRYHVASAAFHCESVPDHSFFLKFSSKKQDEIQIEKIVLSFSDNKDSSFLSSPGVLLLDRNAVNANGALSPSAAGGNAIELKGRQSRILSKRSILVSDKPLATSVTIENVGSKPTRVYVGFAVSTKNRTELRGNHYPYKNISKVLTVVSSEAGSDKLIVDSYSDWAKNCCLALHAEEDLFDVPNTTLANGRIVEVKKLDNGTAEITMDKPFGTAPEPGTKVRIHGAVGGYLYTGNKVLQPGEKEVFTSSIKKDNAFLQFSNKAFSRGVYSVKPLVLSYSVDPNDENTVVISDFTVSY